MYRDENFELVNKAFFFFFLGKVVLILVTCLLIPKKTIFKTLIVTCDVLLVIYSLARVLFLTPKFFYWKSYFLFNRKLVGEVTLMTFLLNFITKVCAECVFTTTTLWNLASFSTVATLP